MILNKPTVTVSKETQEAGERLARCARNRWNSGRFKKLKSPPDAFVTGYLLGALCGMADVRLSQLVENKANLDTKGKLRQELRCGMCSSDENIVAASLQAKRPDEKIISLCGSCFLTYQRNFSETNGVLTELVKL